MQSGLQVVDIRSSAGYQDQDESLLQSDKRQVCVGGERRRKVCATRLVPNAEIQRRHGDFEGSSRQLCQNGHVVQEKQSERSHKLDRTALVPL